MNGRNTIMTARDHQIERMCTMLRQGYSSGRIAERSNISAKHISYCRERNLMTPTAIYIWRVHRNGTRPATDKPNQTNVL